MVDCLGKMADLDSVPGMSVDWMDVLDMMADLEGIELVRCSVENFRIGQVDILGVLGCRVWVDLVDMILGLSEGMGLVRYSADNFQVDSMDILVGNLDILVDLDIHHQTDIVHCVDNHKLAIENSNVFQDHMTSKLRYRGRTDKI